MIDHKQYCRCFPCAHKGVLACALVDPCDTFNDVYFGGGAAIDITGKSECTGFHNSIMALVQFGVWLSCNHRVLVHS